ncbi:MAG: SprB repeat-containing protein, partial [Bacteroidota bacterium]
MKTRLLPSAICNYATMGTSLRTSTFGICVLLVMSLTLPHSLQAQDCPTIFSVDTTDPTDCQSNGTIEVFADDSFPAGPFYVYSVDGGENYINTSTINFLPAGTYTIAVQNTETTCTTIWPVPVTLFGDGEPIVIESVNLTHPSDCGADDGIIVINVEGGGGSTLTSSYEYSVTGINGPWIDSNTFFSRPAGIYDVWVRNLDDSCPTNYGEVELTDPPQPSISGHSTTASTQCSPPNGTISLTGSGGIAPLQYSINGPGGPWVDAPDISGVAPGNYNTWVRNNNGTCAAFYSTVTVNGVSPITISQVTGLDPTGCNTNDGRVTITAFGTSTLEYSITGEGGPYSTDPVFTDQGPGTYNIFVRYTNGSCLTSGGPFTLTGPEPPIIAPSDVSTTAVSDCGANDGSITIALPDNYNDDMEFSIDGTENWQFSNVFNGLAPGSYNVWVQYSDGTCAVSYGFFTVGTPLGPLIGNITITPTDASDCGATDGSIAIESPITYEYSLNGNGPPWSLQLNYDELAPAIYEVWVRNEDGTCPTFHSFVTVSGPEAPIINGASDITITPVSTCGLSNGTIRIGLPINYNPQMEFSITGINGTWSPFNLFTDIAAGFYDIWVRNGDESCPVNYGVFEVTEPNSINIDLITVDPTNISDCGLSDGAMSVCSANEFYEYSINGSGGPWDNPSGTCSEFINLVAGTYSVWVRNDDGTCETFWGSVTINEPQAPFITDVSSTDVSDCGAGDGSITITAGGGDGNLQYSVNGPGGPFGPASQFNGLSGNDYDVYVRNGDGTCLTFWGTVTIDEPETPIIVSVTATDITDCGANNGTIQISATGTSIQYSIDGGPAGGTWSSTSSFNNLIAGVYDIWVRNSDGTCEVPWGVETIDEPQAPSITNVSVTDVSNCGASDGSIQITASGGDGNLRYSINGPGGPFGPASIFNGQSGGTFDIYVRNGDGSCLTFWGTETIDEPELPVITNVIVNDVSDCGANDGSIQISAIGSSLEYSINGSGGPFGPSPNLSNLNADTYNIWVRNSDGTCPVPWGTEIISEPDAPVISNVFVSDIQNCGTNDGFISITASGSSGNLEYSITGPTGTFQSSGVFPNLASDDYDIWVQYDNGTCLTSWGIENVAEGEFPVISAVDLENVSDCGGSDGSIAITASISVGLLEYSINGPGGPYQLDNTFTGLISNSYDLWVRPNERITCATNWGTVFIDEPQPPAIVQVITTDPSDCGVNDATVEIIAELGLGTYEYSISGEFGPWIPGNFITGLSGSDLF